MNELVARTSAWLQAVLAQVPAKIHAIYVEFDYSYMTPTMEQSVCFNAFGFESLANGHFDPSSMDHVRELGDFQWEPSGGYGFRTDEYPATDWMAILKDAARTSGVTKLAAARGLQLLVGEHDCDVFVIR
jgi:hypothetical protein